MLFSPLDDFQLRNKKWVPVFYRGIKYRYDFGCVWIKARVLWLHAPERVRIFYSAIKHGYRCFISILTRQDRLYLS